MGGDMSNQAHAVAHDEHPPTTIREYVIIGIVLTVVTAVELWASYNAHILGGALIPVLLVLSAFKFAVVVAMFMHLRFENPFLTRVFACGLILATCIMLALITLFWNNDTDAVGGAKSGWPAPAAGAAKPGEATAPTGK
jgi:cytochrome c oxidase subunit 4